jgi:putative Mn2+ efflux pump MntP
LELAEPEEETSKHYFYILAHTAAAIGFATFAMVTIGVMLGQVLGLMFGKRSEIVGGLVLIAIGSYYSL